MMGFSYDTTEQKVVFGSGVSERLGEILDDFGWNRFLLCTSPHLVRNGTVGRMRSMLQRRITTVYDQTPAHVPFDQVREVVTSVTENEVDAIVALGGGSVIGLAKAVSFELAVGHKAAERKIDGALPIAAVPTTYAGSEMTPVFGVTWLEADGSMRKITQRDSRIVPRIALYDPLLTLDLPPELTAASGVNALAHGIEAVYSLKRNPLSTAAALRAVQLISRALPACIDQRSDVDARSEMMEGAHLAAVSLATVSMGIHHGTGHVLGGTAGIAHGVANCIVLPHAIRFNADTVPMELAMVAEVMGVERDGRSDFELALAAADAAEKLIGQLGMPQRLRDVGIKQVQLPSLARNLLLSKAVQTNPKPLAGEQMALMYLEDMW